MIDTYNYILADPWFTGVHAYFCTFVVYTYIFTDPGFYTRVYGLYSLLRGLFIVLCFIFNGPRFYSWVYGLGIFVDPQFFYTRVRRMAVVFIFIFYSIPRSWMTVGRARSSSMEPSISLGSV